MKNWGYRLVFVLAATCIQALLGGCSLAPILATQIGYDRQPPIDLHTVLISPANLPSRWRLGRATPWLPGAPNFAGEEDLRANFVTEDPDGRTIGGLSQHIYRFHDPHKAQLWFDFMQTNSDYFPVGGEWSQPPPPTWQPGSRRADQRYSRCIELYLRYYCGEIVRHSEFVSVLWANVEMDTPNMNPAYLTMAELEAMLIAVDKQFVEVLGATTTTP